MLQFVIVQVILPIAMCIYALARILLTEQSWLSLTGAMLVVGVLWLLQSLSSLPSVRSPEAAPDDSEADQQP